MGFFKEVTGSKITRRDFLLQLATKLYDQYATAYGRQHASNDDDEDEDYMEPVLKRCQISYCKAASKI